MAQKFLQVNINHSAVAQDLLIQTMAEWSIQVVLVTEPYFIPPRHNWAGDVSGTAAIITSNTIGSPMMTVLARDAGFVAAKLGELVVVSVYFSPNKTFVEFEAFLDKLGTFIRRSLPCPMLVAGDFNAKSAAWGSPVTDIRGRALHEWTLEIGLCVVNQGSAYTCVRQQGGSIVDVTFADPVVARRIRDWAVMTETESLSDHLYIRFDIGNTAASPVSTREVSLSSRWAIKRLNKDLLAEASIVESWFPPPDGPVDIVEETRWFREAMTRISDAAMPRSRSLPPRRQAYWWTSEIAQLRTVCVAARRQLARHRRRRRSRDATVEARLYESYREAKKTLQITIRRAKARAREDLLETLDSDPWGRPYRMVLGFLRPWAPPVTQSLQPQLLGVILSELFPQRAEHSPPFRALSGPRDQTEQDETLQVTVAELDAAVRRLREKNTAPGPDGIPGRVWVLALEALGDRLRRLFSACLVRGLFPPQWKVGRLVLLRKQGRPVESSSAYRPIVLLDEAGKLFERVVARRLTKHLTRIGPDLAEVQFGFREGRSTVDAILRVKTLSEEVISQGGVLLAVSLDIANAFNSLPWECILEGLKYHRVPQYLVRLVQSYLRDRQVTCIGQDGRTHQREMSCGVPQGSVLGPLLWNIGYDWVLRGVLLPGAAVTCYADDTLVTARGDTLRDAIRLATASVAQVVRRIRLLGLDVALNKTEAICFYGPRRVFHRGAHMIVGGVQIQIGTRMKYLGLILDSRWTFGDHFAQMAPKVKRTASVLAGILPNIGGANVGCRSLYLGVIRSMALYGAPVWHEALTATNSAVLRNLQRIMAVRVIRGYRTISCEAACLLASSPPWDLLARVHADMYRWRSSRLLRGESIAPREEEAQRAHLHRALLSTWRDRLADATAGLNTISAIRPLLVEWVERSHGVLTFRLVQVLTGHGCFGKYLHQVAGRELTPRCHHCDGCEVETSQHVLEECPAWESERRELVAVVGDDLSLPAVIRSMVGRESAWNAVVAFCESVLSQKEDAERERERAADAPAVRRGRTGRRSRRGGGTFHHMPP